MRAVLTNGRQSVRVTFSRRDADVLVSPGGGFSVRPAARARRLLRKLAAIGWYDPTLRLVMEAAEREQYRRALERHAGNIGEAAAELGVHRDTASAAIGRLGLREWLDEQWPHRNPATFGRQGETRKRI